MIHTKRPFGIDDDPRIFVRKRVKSRWINLEPLYVDGYRDIRQSVVILFRRNGIFRDTRRDNKNNNNNNRSFRTYAGNARIERLAKSKCFRVVIRRHSTTYIIARVVRHVFPFNRPVASETAKTAKTRLATVLLCMDGRLAY